jgi:hypothetical protein
MRFLRPPEIDRLLAQIISDNQAAAILGQVPMLAYQRPLAARRLPSFAPSNLEIVLACSRRTQLRELRVRRRSGRFLDL